uniref:Uncharacterized protein n=1 Tax=Burkholderia sp. M701 TaxID=326454 RepID=V5YP20_9BURK|nr:hypothetical protein [Burkholderia sp. M701]
MAPGSAGDAWRLRRQRHSNALGPEADQQPAHRVLRNTVGFSFLASALLGKARRLNSHQIRRWRDTCGLRAIPLLRFQSYRCYGSRHTFACFASPWVTHN